MISGAGAAQPSFAARLEAAVQAKKSCLVVGLDPVVERLPGELLGRARQGTGSAGWTAHAAVAVGLFLREVLRVTAPHAVAAKANLAFFERLGAAGWDCLRRVCEEAKDLGLLVIADAKRGDVGSTAEAYAEAFLGDIPDTLGPVTDAVTLNPYLGSDNLKPFLRWARPRGKGVFVLVRTSNPSAAEIQELPVDRKPLFQHVAAKVRCWSEELDATLLAGDELSSVGAVVGALTPLQSQIVRAELPRAFLLVPGYGAQGGTAEDVAPCFLAGGRGVIVNASRSVLYAYEKQDGPWLQAVEGAAVRAKQELEAVRWKSRQSTVDSRQ
jgi:orotidine-5'-phosphate decarboxylase